MDDKLIFQVNVDNQVDVGMEGLLTLGSDVEFSLPNPKSAYIQFEEIQLAAYQNDFEISFQEKRQLYEQQRKELEDMMEREEPLRLVVSGQKNKTVKLKHERFCNWSFMLMLDNCQSRVFGKIQKGQDLQLYIHRIQDNYFVYLSCNKKNTCTRDAQEKVVRRLRENPNALLRVMLEEVFDDRLLVSYEGVMGVIPSEELFYLWTEEGMEHYRKLVGEGEKGELEVYLLQIDENGHIAFSETGMTSKPSMISSSLSGLQVGQIVECVPYKYFYTVGIFVSNAYGNGLIPMSSLGQIPWGEIKQRYPLGKPVQVRVHWVDRKKNRIGYQPVDTSTLKQFSIEMKMLLDTTTNKVGTDILEGQLQPVKLVWYVEQKNTTYVRCGDKYRGVIFTSSIPDLLQPFWKEMVEQQVEIEAVAHTSKGKYEFNVKEAMRLNKEALSVEYMAPGYRQMHVCGVLQESSRLLLQWKGLYALWDYAQGGYQSDVFAKGTDLTFFLQKVEEDGSMTVVLRPVESQQAEWDALNLQRGDVVTPTRSWCDEKGQWKALYDHCYEGVVLDETMTSAVQTLNQLLVLEINPAEKWLLLANDGGNFVYKRDLLQETNEYMLEPVRFLHKNLYLMKLEQKWTVMQVAEEDNRFVRILEKYFLQGHLCMGAEMEQEDDSSLARFHWNRRLADADYTTLLAGKPVTVEVKQIENGDLLFVYQHIVGMLPAAAVARMSKEPRVNQRLEVVFTHAVEPVTHRLIFAWSQEWMLGVSVGDTVTLERTDSGHYSYCEVVADFLPQEVEGISLENVARLFSKLQAVVMSVDREKHVFQVSVRAYLEQLWEDKPIQIGQIFDDLFVLGTLPEQQLAVMGSSIYGILPYAALGGSDEALAALLYPVGTQVSVSVQAIPSEKMPVRFALNRIVPLNVWPDVRLSVGERLQARVCALDVQAVLLEIRGILVLVTDEAAVYTWANVFTKVSDWRKLPLRIGGEVEVRVEAFDRKSRLLRVQPVTQLVWKVGQCYEMYVEEHLSDGIGLFLTNCIGYKYQLLKDEYTEQSLHSYPFDQIPIGTPIKVLLMENRLVSLKRALRPMAEEFCKGCIRLATVLACLETSVVMAVDDYWVEVDARGMQLGERLIARLLHEKIYPVGYKVYLRVVDFSLPGGLPRWEVAYEPVRNQVSLFRIVDVDDEWTVAVNEEGVTQIPTVATYQEGDVLPLVAFDRKDGMLMSRPLCPSDHWGLMGTVWNCKLKKIEEEMVQWELPEAYQNQPLVFLMKPEEWSWSGERLLPDMGYEGLTFAVQVVRVNEDVVPKEVFVSRRLLLEDATPVTAAVVGHRRQVKVVGTSDKGYLFDTGGISGLLSWEECGWVSLDTKVMGHLFQRRKDFLQEGELVQVQLLAFDADTQTCVGSLKAFCPDAWKNWQAQVRLNEIQWWTVCKVRHSFVFLSHGDLIWPIPTLLINKSFGYDYVSRMKVGERFPLRITAFRKDSEMFDYLIDGVSQEKYVQHLPVQGEVVECRIQEITGTNRLLLDGGYWIGSVPQGDVCWGIPPKGQLPFRVGERVRCRVEEVSPEKRKLICNTRVLLPCPEELLTVGKVYPFTLTAIEETQLLLAGPHQEQGILMGDQSGLTMGELQAAFRPGDTLYAQVLELDYEHNRIQCALSSLKQWIQVDSIVDCTVVEAMENGIRVNCRGILASIPKMELSWSPYDLSRLYTPGEEIQAKVVSYAWPTCALSLSIKALKPNPWEKGKLAVGTVIQVQVILVSNKRLVFKYRSLYGCIHIEDALPQRFYKLSEFYHVGQKLGCEVIAYEPERQLLRCRCDINFGALLKSESLAVGQIRQGRVVQVSQTGMLVQVGKLRGYVSLDNLYWVRPYQSGIHYKVGDNVQVRCLEIHSENGNIVFTTRLDEPQVADGRLLQLLPEGLLVSYLGSGTLLKRDGYPSWVYQVGDMLRVQPQAQGEEYHLVQKAPEQLPVQVGEDIMVLVRAVYPNRGLAVTCGDFPGYIPRSELGWLKAERDAERYTVGQRVQVRCSQIHPSGVLQFSVRALSPDPMGGIEVGMLVQFRISEVCDAGLWGEANGKRSWMERSEVGYAYQYDFIPSLLQFYRVGQTLLAKVLKVDREKGVLCLSNQEEPIHALSDAVMEAKVLKFMEKEGTLQNTYLVQIGNSFALLPLAESSYQTHYLLHYLPGEEIRVCMNKEKEKDSDTGLPLVSYVQCNPDPFKGFIWSKEEAVKARAIGWTSDGLVVTLPNGVRSCIPIRFIYETKEEYETHPYRAGDELDVILHKINARKLDYLPVRAYHPQPRSVEYTECKVTVFQKERLGYDVWTESGLLGWIPASQVDYKESHTTEMQSIKEHEEYTARVVSSGSELSVLTFSLRDPVPIEEKYPSRARVEGTVDGKNKKGYSIDLGDASGFIRLQDVTWKVHDPDEELLQIGRLYDFQVLYCRNTKVHLSRLFGTLPFDKQGQAEGRIIRSDKNKIYILVDRIETYALVDQNNSNLGEFNTAFGRKKILKGTRVIVRLDGKPDYVNHTIRVSIVDVKE